MEDDDNWDSSEESYRPTIKADNSYIRFVQRTDWGKFVDSVTHDDSRDSRSSSGRKF